MTLSNTATPVYYGMFRDAVERGLIPVNREVGLEMERIDALIANPHYYYNDRAIGGFIKFCENELTLTDGSPLKLLDTFKLWAESVLSWFYYEETSVYVPNASGIGGHWEQRKKLKRLVRKQYLIVARGAAKSMYATCLQAYFLINDKSTTMGITTAPTMKQAQEVIDPIKTAITRAPGPLFQYLTHGSINATSGSRMDRVKLASTKKGIEYFFTGSTIQVLPMRIDKLQGYRSRYNTIDEWLSGDVREDVVSAIEQSAAKGGDDNYLIIAISSEGTVRNGPGDTIKMELMSILKGDYVAPHVSIWWYKLDSIEEVANPEMWIKAQPNLPHTVTYEAYHLDVERAEKAPATRNDILAKRFGIPMEGYTYFFTYEETQIKPSPHSGDFWQMPCAMGADLSQGDDFTAFTFIFPLPDGRFGIKTRSYVSSYIMTKLPGAMRSKYEEFVKEGSLIVLDGTILDMMEVYDNLDEYIRRMQWDVRAFGYDPYNAKEFVMRWETENGAWGIEKVIQGARTESVPLGELKHLSEQNFLIFDQLLMTFAMGNTVVSEDTNGNRKLLKMRQDQKIDNVAAMMDGWVAYKLNKDSFE